MQFGYASLKRLLEPKYIVAPRLAPQSAPPPASGARQHVKITIPRAQVRAQFIDLERRARHQQF